MKAMAPQLLTLQYFHGPILITLLLASSIAGASSQAYVTLEPLEYCNDDVDIVTSAECRQAAIFLDIPYAQDFNGPEDHRSCFVANDGRGTVYFNTAGSAAAASPYVAQYNTICKAAQASHLIDSLILYSDMHTLDGDGKLVDSSGNGHNGEISGSGTGFPSTGGVRDGGYTHFTGSGSINLPYVDEIIMPGSPDRSVCCWFRGSKGFLFSFGHTVTAGSFAALLDDDYLKFQGHHHDHYKREITFNDGNWHHLCYVSENQKIIMYFDGVAVDTTLQSNLNVRSAANSGSARIGANGDGGVQWRGDIDELYIYSRALSASEVATVLNAEVAQACEADCQTCSDSTTCTTCENDKFLDSNGDCITSCPAGYASLGSDPGKYCEACEADCQTCSDSTTCTTCENDKFLDSNGDCITSCPAGYAGLGSDPGKYCEAYTCAMGSSGTACLTCETPASRTTNDHCATCNLGHFLSGTGCQANQCTCLNGQVIANGIDCTNDGDNQCVSCDAGFFLHNAECQACEADCQTCSDSTTCTTCENDKFLDSNGDCIPSCPAGYAGFGSDPGKYCEAFGCTIGPDNGCKSCVSQEQRVDDASCGSCNDGYYVDDLSCEAICTEGVSDSRICTCPVGTHGSTTLVGNVPFGGCHPNPTSVEDWIIRISNEDNATSYDDSNDKITVKFEKSGGRDHELSIFMDDCITPVANNELLKLSSTDGRLAGVNPSNLNNEFLYMEIDVNLSRIESSSMIERDSSLVNFCVRVDLKFGVGTSSHGVSFIRARLAMQVNIVANIQQVSVQLESTDSDISMEDALTHVIELDACQCGIGDLDPNDRCVKRTDAHEAVAVTSPPKLTPSDILSLCISTQTDVVEIHKIDNLKLTQESDSGLSRTFDVIGDSSVSSLASYNGSDMKIGHIHRVRTPILNVFFENTGSGTVDQESITVSGTAVV